MNTKHHVFSVAFVALVLFATLGFSQQAHADVTSVSSATSLTGAQRQALIVQLTAQVQALLAQVAALTGGASGTFSGDLQLGSTGSDVKALQVWLNSHGFLVAQTGPGSLGNETSYFGALTQAALAKFQTAYDVNPPVGYFGPLTRAAIATLPNSSAKETNDTNGNSNEPAPQNSQSTPPSNPCSAPSGLTCIPGTNIIQPAGGGSNYSPGYGGGSPDQTNPVISSSANITAEATSASGAAVSYTTLIATDNVDGTISVSCTPASGSTFAIGTTTVSCSATDRATNTSSGSFTITVQDTTAPTVSVTAPANSATVSGSAVTISATASDAVGVVGVQFKVDSANTGTEDTSSPYSITWDSMGVADGSHTLAAIARDTAGNLATPSVSVTVDNTAPVISAISSTTPSASSMVVTWTTDEPSDSQVNYGTTSSYGATTTLDSTLTTSHSITISGLVAGTTYNFRVRSTDGQRHLAVSSDQTATVFPGIALEDFENSADFTFAGTSGGTAANDTASLYTKTKSLKITTASSGSVNYYGTKNVSWDLSQGGILLLWANIPSPSLATLTLYLTSANFAGSKFLSKAITTVANNPGAQIVPVDLADFAVSGGESISNLMTQFRVRVDTAPAAAGTIYVDSLYYRKMDRPRIVLSFDDSYASQYTEAFSYMQSKSMAGTMYTVKNLVGTANHVTLSQLQTMYAAGWDVANHTTDHVAFNSKDVVGIAASQTPATSFTINGTYATGGIATLDTPRNITFFPSGNDQSKKWTITGKLAGQTVTEIVYGKNATWSVSTGLFDEVDSITTSATSSASITVGVGRTQAEITTALQDDVDYLTSNGMSRGAYHFAYPQGEFNTSSDAALAAVGILTGRTTQPGVTPTAVGIPNAKMLYAQGAGGSYTLASAKLAVDDAIRYGGTYNLYFHDLIAGTPTLSTQWQISNFEALIDYIATKRDAGLLDVLPITQWYSDVVVR